MAVAQEFAHIELESGMLVAAISQASVSLGSDSFTLRGSHIAACIWQGVPVQFVRFVGFKIHDKSGINPPCLLFAPEATSKQAHAGGAKQTQGW